MFIEENYKLYHEQREQIKLPYLSTNTNPLQYIRVCASRRVCVCHEGEREKEAKRE